MHSYSRAQSMVAWSPPPPPPAVPPSLPPPPPPAPRAAAVVTEEVEEGGEGEWREGGLERACASFKISSTSFRSSEGWREGRHSSVV